MISNRIRIVRKQKGYTLRDLESISKISKTTISDIENHVIDPRLSTAFKISKALNVRFGELFIVE